MKFNLGDTIKYTNKVDKIDVLGEIIAIQNSFGSKYFIVEPISGNHGAYLSFFSCSKADRNVDYFSHKFNESSFSYVKSKNRILYVPVRSKNVTSGILQYDPSQQGEDDDSV